jgi:hypothetical protein
VSIFRELRRLLRPPRVVAVTRRPAGWLAVGRRRLETVVCWAVLEDDQVVGLVASRRGLRPATGRGFHGFLPGGATGARDVQPSPPAVSVPVADLTEAIGPTAGAYPTTPAALSAIYGRLKVASLDEWAVEAMLGFIHDPNRFLERHLELRVEHLDPAELNDDWRAGLAAITTPAAGAGITQEENR